MGSQEERNRVFIVGVGCTAFTKVQYGLCFTCISPVPIQVLDEEPSPEASDRPTMCDVLFSPKYPHDPEHP
jgi:hypothetical protein